MKDHKMVDLRARMPNRMSKIHFELIAEIIRQVRDPVERIEIAKAVSGRLSCSNGLFDKQRFIEAATRSA